MKLEVEQLELSTIVASLGKSRHYFESVRIWSLPSFACFFDFRHSLTSKRMMDWYKKQQCKIQGFREAEDKGPIKSNIKALK